MATNTAADHLMQCMQRASAPENLSRHICVGIAGASRHRGPLSFFAGSLLLQKKH